ncbi:conserved Plasmodium protein, unknown function [Plasmodium malariae]|uniref:Uncharacterized protein n=1 Tax=Plasmodium malariae TaxID=5858 RepID=A0A1C3KBT3_PLAMA|nr:conserved Plasmodium protein, unknown function [Plasmodium malariae]
MKKSKNYINLFLLSSTNSLILLIFMEIFFFLLDGINTFEFINIQERISQIILCTFLVIQVGVLKVAEVFSKNKGKQIVIIHYLFIIYIFLLPLLSFLLLTSALSWTKIVYFAYILSLATSIKIRGLLTICVVTLIMGFVRFYHSLPTSTIILCFTLLLIIHVPLDVSDVNCSSTHTFFSVHNSEERKVFQNEGASSFLDGGESHVNRYNNPVKVNHKKVKDKNSNRKNYSNKYFKKEKNIGSSARGEKCTQGKHIIKEIKVNTSNDGINCINDNNNGKDRGIKNTKYHIEYTFSQDCTNSNNKIRNIPTIKHSNIKKINNKLVNRKLDDLNDKDYGETCKKKKIVQKHFSLLRSGLRKISRKRNILLSEELKNNINYIYFDNSGKIKQSKIIPIYVLDRHNLNDISTYLRENTATKNSTYFKIFTLLNDDTKLTIHEKAMFVSLGLLKSPNDQKEHVKRCTCKGEKTKYYHNDNNKKENFYRNKYSSKSICNMMDIINSGLIPNFEKKRTSNCNFKDSSTDNYKISSHNKWEGNYQGSTRMFYLVNPVKKNKGVLRISEHPDYTGKKEETTMPYCHFLSVNDANTSVVRDNLNFLVNKPDKRSTLHSQGSSDDILSSKQAFYIDDAIDDSVNSIITGDSESEMHTYNTSSSDLTAYKKGEGEKKTWERKGAKGTKERNVDTKEESGELVLTEGNSSSRGANKGSVNKRGDRCIDRCVSKSEMRDKGYYYRFSCKRKRISYGREEESCVSSILNTFTDESGQKKKFEKKLGNNMCTKCFDVGRNDDGSSEGGMSSRGNRLDVGRDGSKHGISDGSIDIICDGNKYGNSGDNRNGQDQFPMCTNVSTTRIKKKVSCYRIPKLSMRLKDESKIISKKKNFFLEFHDHISINYKKKPYNAEKKKMCCSNWRKYFLSINPVSNIFRKIKLIYEYVQKKEKYWKKYNNILYTSEWDTNMQDNELEYILNYKNFTKWYDYWVKTLKYNYYKSTYILNLLLLFFNVLLVYLQLHLFYLVFKTDNSHMKPLNQFYVKREAPFDSKYYNINNCIDEKVFLRYIYIRIPTQLFLNTFLVLPCVLIKQCRNINLLNHSAVINCFVNIFFGMIDISYSLNGRIYNLDELYIVLNYYNIFDIFLIGKLITTIFLIPFITNFNEYKTSPLIYFSCFCYIATFYYSFNPFSFSIKLMYITNFVLLIATAISTAYYSW